MTTPAGFQDTMNSTPATRDPWFDLNRKTSALVVVDLVESVRLMQADEADTIDRWRRFAAEVRSQVLPRHQGRLVKSLGDGLLLEFEHVHAALAAALDIQRGICPYNADRAADAAMHLRAGVHVAEVVVDDLDIYGAGVNLAARLAGLAGPDEIVVSSAVRDQAVPGLDAEFEDMGLCYLKHLNEPVQAYRAVPVQAWSNRRFSVGQKNTPVAPSLVPAVAIIPFSVHNPEPGHRVVGELLADTLIAKMAGADRLRVISRLSTTALASRACTAAEMGQLLGANFVASGRVQVQGGRLLLWVELADARSDQVVWADQFDGTVAELAERDSPVIEEVCAALIRHVAAHELRRVQHLPLPTLEGFSLQLSGMSLMHRSTKQEFDRAREVLEYLIERHPRAP
jgi:adenylate cyclase